MWSPLRPSGTAGVSASMRRRVATPPAGPDWAGSVDSLVSASVAWSFLAKDEPMTWRHLANMTGNYATDLAPGSFNYNDHLVDLHCASLESVFGGSSLDTYFQNRIGQHLGFQDAATALTLRNNRGANLSPRDFARFGLLILNNGNWNGQQLIPSGWLDFIFDVDTNGVSGATSAPAATFTSDYLAVGSYGSAGAVDQLADTIGPGYYGWNWWMNGIVPAGRTYAGNRYFNGMPLDTLSAEGSWGREVMCVIPSLGLIVAGYGDFGRAELETQAGNPSGKYQNDRIGYLTKNGILGDPSYAAEFPGASWTTATDAEAGLSTAILDGMITGLRSLSGDFEYGVVIRNGRLVRAWGTPAQTQLLDWKSAGKVIHSTMLGIAISEGLI